MPGLHLIMYQGSSETRQCANVKIFDDNLREPVESLNITLSGPLEQLEGKGFTLHNSYAILNINMDSNDGKF